MLIRLLLFFVLYAMADFKPPPLFSPTNAETDVADTGSVTIHHGEIPCLVVDPEVLSHVHPPDHGPEGGAMSTTSPPPPDREPGKPVRPHLPLINLHSSFVQSRRASNRTL